MSEITDRLKPLSAVDIIRPTFDDVSALIAPRSPIGIGHHEAEDIAMTVMFIVGDATKHMTGEVLHVSYGSAARHIG